jgi:SAM-dependent methyltransferase
MADWPKYINKTKGGPPRRLLVHALNFVQNKDAALDIGAGALNDSIYLLQNGFGKIIALDKVDLSELTTEFEGKAFSFIKDNISDYAFPEKTFDLINAQYFLPFIPAKELGRVMNDAKKSLKHNGIFTGQFFGPRDSWSFQKGVSTHSKTEVEKLLENLDILFFNEEEKDDTTVSGAEKHWHIFHFIAKKVSD